MKKMTLLFLALSAVAFSQNNSLKSSIEVTVSAVVAGEAPSISITDENDFPISSLFFDHFFQQGETSTEDVLFRNLKVKGNTLRGDNVNNLNANFSNSNGTVHNWGNKEYNLTSELTAELDIPNVALDKTIDSVPLKVTSTLAGIPGSDEYGVFNTQLIVTLNKVSTTP